MQSDNGTIRVAISADESADWRVCGLRQIDRIGRALDAFERSSGRRIALTGDPADADLALSTRVVLARDSVADRLNGNPAAGKYLSTRADIPAAESWLVRQLGKPEDGWISRYVNRPISTRITRVLLRFPVRPVHASMAAFVVALIGCAVLLRGDYWSVLAGTLFLNLFSVLDGCDGEIARVNYLQSRAGHWIDFVADTTAQVLFVISLGAGLARASGRSWLLFEGLATAALVVLTELLLGGVGREYEAARPSPASPLYRRHETMLSNSGALGAAKRLVEFIAQITKRDMAWLAFVVLAAINHASWILHLSLAVGFATCVLSTVAIIRGPSR